MCWNVSLFSLPRPKTKEEWITYYFVKAYCSYLSEDKFNSGVFLRNAIGFLDGTYKV